MFTSSLRTLRRGLVAAPFLLGSLALAQTNDADPNVLQLDPLVVTDAKSLITTLPVRPVTGVFGFESSNRDTPRSIFQINPEQFENDFIASVSDLARYSPSVNQATGYIENYGTPNLRGAQGDAYQNGVRLITRGGNNRPFTTNSYEGADIVAGPAPIIFGTSARTAGYINYLTKKPYFDRNRGSVSWTIGKFYGDGTGYKPQNTVQVDVGGPLIDRKLAYRVSVEGTDREQFFKGRDTRYGQVYGTLGWLPDARTAVDLNFEYGRFFWQSNNYQNRVTNELIRDRTYLAGPATPIIQVGTAFYSPVLTSAGNVTSWLRRTRVVNADGTNGFTAGAAVGDPTSNTTAGAGTIIGYVLDPALVRPVKVDDSLGLNAPGYDSETTAINAQLRAKRQFSDGFTLVNNATYQYYQTNNPSNGGVHNWIKAQVLEDRLEALLTHKYQVFGHEVRHQSNTGVSYRWEPNLNYKDGQRAGYGPTGDQYDLTADPSTFTRNAFFGATVYPFSGTINDPVLTRFGYLKGFWAYYPVPESPGDYNTPGGTGATPIGTLASQTYDTTLKTSSVFTQHRFDVGRFIVDAGARWSELKASITNPLPSPLVPGNDTIGDSIREENFSYSASLSFRVSDQLTAYYTYADIEAVNGNTSGAVAWPRTALDQDRGPNKFSTRDFHSVSKLKEAGLKFEAIPDKLFLTAAAYEQTRLLTVALPAGFTEPLDAIGVFRGVELGVRYQPSRHVFVGASYTYLDAITKNSTYSVAAPLVADNFTNFQSNTTAVQQDFRVTATPRSTASAFANYEFSSGFGLRGDLSLRSSANVDSAGVISVPGYFAANLGFYYTHDRYRFSIDIQNITNVDRRAGGTAPLEPINLQGRIVYRF